MAGTVALALAMVFGIGCQQNVSTLDPSPEQPHKGQRLRIQVSPVVEPIELLQQYTREWTLRQRVDVTMLRDPLERFTGDIAIVTAAELPLLVDSDRFLPLPDSITKNNEHPYQWDGLLPAFSGPIGSWGGVGYGLPILGEGHVLVYRKDRLQEAKLNPPASWDDYVAAAKILAKPGRPSLPPLPKRALDLEVEFHLIAASYDRQGLSQGEVSSALNDPESADRLLSYQYTLTTGQARIQSQAFVQALQILRDLQPFRRPGEADDPGAVFADGSAALAIVSLRDLYRFQAPGSPVRGKIGIAPVPGSRFTFDAAGERVPTRGNSVNRIPYLGARTLIGLVSKDCANPSLAWEFLSGLAAPDKMGAEAITAGKWGAGPFRYLHIEERGRFLWYGYDLSRDDTEHLIVALKDQLQPNIVNPCFRLRLPNEKAHASEFDAAVRAALAAPKFDPQQTLKDLAARWRSLWIDVPDARRRSWVRMCYGLRAQ